MLFFFATMKYNNRPTDKKFIHLHYFQICIIKKVNNLFLLLIGYMEKNIIFALYMPF